MNRPYFECEIVKVKKKKTYSNHTIIDGKKYVLYQDKKGNVYPHKNKGNWVNGENLDKIKFPCFCRFRGNQPGMLASGYPSYDNDKYILHSLKEQGECSTIYRSNSLKELIESYDIHILKGKIIIFEEDENKEYDIDIEEEDNE